MNKIDMLAETSGYDSPTFLLAKKFNSFYLNKLHNSSYKPFVIENKQVGFITEKILNVIEGFKDVFVIEEECVKLHPSLADYDQRSQVMERVLQTIRDKNILVALNGWRNECYEVRQNLHSVSLMQIERSAACLFGIRQYAIVINGYVMHPTKGLCVWFQQRSKTKQTWPGYFDNMVGGGISVGYTVLETAHKEAHEEASIPWKFLSKLVSVDPVTIFYESVRGLSPNMENVFDLELPVDFVPLNRDGEVQSFHLFTAQEAFENMLKPTFKTTSAPPLMDFLIRKGVITAQNEPNVECIKKLLHVPLNSIYREI